MMEHNNCNDPKTKFKPPTAAPLGQVDLLVMPIMLGFGKKHERSIPFSMLNEKQAYTNHGQTLKRLAERGGLAACEAIAIMDGRRWKHMDAEVSLAELIKRLEAGEA